LAFFLHLWGYSKIVRETITSRMNRTRIVPVDVQKPPATALMESCSFHLNSICAGVRITGKPCMGTLKNVASVNGQQNKMVRLTITSKINKTRMAPVEVKPAAYPMVATSFNRSSTTV